MSSDKEVLKIVVVGHVDHGKSTVIGRLLYDTHSIPEGKIERVKKTCKEKGKPFEYAYLLDAFEEEQKQGITIDTTQLQFFTKKRDYVIIDAPGHKEFLKNMISGAANAEAALLIIDALEGVQEQSKRHGYILSLLGIQKVYVIVNKMDLIDYSEEKFNDIRTEMNKFLNSLHVYPIEYIPISAFYGENLITKSEKLDWYEGESLLDSVDLIEKDKGIEEKPLRLPIQDVYKFDNRRIIAGRIESGTLNVGDEILINPGNKRTRVKTIEYWADRDNVSSVSAGKSVGITLEDEFFNKRGELITHLTHEPVIANRFKANLFWMGKKSLTVGEKYKLKLVTQEIECEIESILKVIDATNLETIENSHEAKTNDVVEVIIKTKEDIALDEFKNNPSTGRFVIVDGYDVSGGGIISGLVHEIQSESKLAANGKEIKIDCFGEHYFVIADGAIKRTTAKTDIFEEGDVVPVDGDTYKYPKDFDLYDVKTKTIAKIRKYRLVGITDIDQYEFEGLDIIDVYGAQVKAYNVTAASSFIDELKSLEANDNDKLAKFNTKWLNYFKFKKLKYIGQVGDVELEYNI